MKNNNPFLQSYAAIVSIFQRVLDVIAIWSGLAFIYISPQNDFNIAVWYSAIVVSVIYIMIAESKKLYESWRGKRLRRELLFISITFISAIAGVFIGHAYLPEYFVVDENDIFAWAIITWTLLMFIRIFFRLILRYLRKVGYNHKKFIIIGAGDLGQQVAKTIAGSPWLGYDLEYFLDDFNTGELRIGEKTYQIRNDYVKALADIGDIDRVYITLPMRAEVRIKQIIEALADTTVSVYLVPDIFTFEIMHSRVEVVKGIPTVSIHESPFLGVNSLLKRIEDIFLATLILIIISIPLTIIALAVKFTSRGPILFKQQRYGLDGRPIKVWKFRSMTVMENGNEVKQASKQDSRFTPIGAFIRKTSLDELPQFINVLTGQMSIVGPRPHAVIHNEQYRKLVRGYMLRHKVKPGITGWAQINGWRGETDTLEKMEKRVEFDLYYIHNWSITMDLKIIFLTIFKGFINKNAY